MISATVLFCVPDCARGEPLPCVDADVLAKERKLFFIFELLKQLVGAHHHLDEVVMHVAGDAGLGCQLDVVAGVHVALDQAIDDDHR